MLVIAILVVCCRADDCTAHCEHWSSEDMDVDLTFVPCLFGVLDLRVATATSVLHLTSEPPVATCGSSGSGSQLSLVAQTTDGLATTLIFTYAESASLVCDSALRQSTTDASLQLLGFSVILGSGEVGTWEMGLSAAQTACESAPVNTNSNDVPVCYSNQGAEYPLRGTSDSSIVKRLGWRATVLFDVNSANVTLWLNNTQFLQQLAQFRCNFNFNTALLQIYDNANQNWALSWTYQGATSCEDLISQLRNGAEPAPDVESAVVVLVGDQVYSWEREISSVPLSDRQIVCGAPSASPMPNRQREPIVPFVQCLSVPKTGPCQAIFGYFNPNTETIELSPESSANQLVPDQWLTHSMIPSSFLPGQHNDSVFVEFPCSKRGRPNVAWKLRTPIRADFAELLESTECSSGCKSDLFYWLTHCSGAIVPDLDGLPLNNDDTVDVMRCAKTDSAIHPSCNVDTQ